MLGVIYSLVVVLGMLMFGSFDRAQRMTAVIGGVASWSLLFLYLPAIRSGSDNLTWIPMPHPIDLLRWYIHNPSAYRLLNVLLIVFIAATVVAAFASRRRIAAVTKPGLKLIMGISSLFLLVPVGLYVISHLFKPLTAGRYMMPYHAGFSCMFAYGLWVAENGLLSGGRAALARVTYALILSGVILLNVITLRDAHKDPVSDIEPLLALEHRLPLVVEQDTIFMQMKYYGGTDASNVYYVIPHSKGNDAGTLGVVTRRGYGPGMVFRQRFLAEHNEFIYLEYPRYNDFYDDAIAGDKHWSPETIGSVYADGKNLPLVHVRHR